MSVFIEVWGDYASFNRPEMKVERVSYDVMTPSAARGLLEAIYWHPSIKWVIDKIYVLNPIEFTTVRRNEVKSKIQASSIKSLMTGGKAKPYISTAEDIQQRAALVLKNVRYVIEAHFNITNEAGPGDSEGKFCDIIRRRLAKGQCYHQPYMGCREFPAFFRKWMSGDIVTAYPDSQIELGNMLYDMDYSNSKNITPIFFRAQLLNGVLSLNNCEVYK